MRTASGSDAGHKRPKNEDSFLEDVERGLFVVADGMGGHPAGEVASREAVAALDEALSGDALGDTDDRPNVLTEPWSPPMRLW